MLVHLCYLLPRCLLRARTPQPLGADCWDLSAEPFLGLSSAASSVATSSLRAFHTQLLLLWREYKVAGRLFRAPGKSLGLHWSCSGFWALKDILSVLAKPSECRIQNLRTGCLGTRGKHQISNVAFLVRTKANEFYILKDDFSS